MRKEDKLRLPPRLKVKLPSGFYIERQPGQYLLYTSYPVVDEQHRPVGTMTDLMGVFPASASAAELETYTVEAADRLEKRFKH